MPKTIKDIIDNLIPIHVKDKPYVKENKINTRKEALAEIRQLLKECKPEDKGGIKGIAVREYTANIEKRLG